MSDLSLIPMDDLTAEINRRCDASLIVTERSVDSGEPEIETIFHGGNSRAIGLAETAKILLLDKIKKTFGDEL